MKTKMNFTCICCTLSAFVICLSTSEGQTLGPEQQMGTGYEPAVNCDRIVDTTNNNKRIQFVWMDKYGTKQGIHWAISHDLGVTWPNQVVFRGTGVIDPVATCDIWSTGSTREMYFGWLGTPQSAQTAEFQRSPSGTFVDQSSVMGAGDRPWLVANTASLYLSLHLGDTGYVKWAAVPNGSGFVNWSGSAIQVFTPDNNTNLVGEFPVATHRDTATPPNEQAFLMAREYGTSSGTNFIRIKRSTNQGVNWSDDILRVNVDGADDFVSDRDLRMVNYHMACDPNTSTSVNRVYAFYVINETAPWGGTRNVLYSLASTDGGNTWGNQQMVYTISQSELPPNGFAVVPPNSSPGFYRIGRVWSCVDSNGNAYVTWMDNRYGEYSTTQDYWHVFCSRSTGEGQTWSAPIRVSGSTTDPLGSASIGGYGNPDPFTNFAWNPPGDFLTCDADSNTLYVAWPDTRANQGNPSALTNVYFRYVPFP